MKKQSSMINFFKKKPDTASSPTPLLLAYQSVPGTPTRSSQPAISTPKKRKADEGASEYRRYWYYKDYEKNNCVLKFLDHWRPGNTWLAYDKEQDIMWCTVCFEFKD